MRSVLGRVVLAAALKAGLLAGTAWGQTYMGRAVMDPALRQPGQPLQTQPPREDPGSAQDPPAEDPPFSQPSSYEWRTGSWGPLVPGCSHTAVQTRSVVCVGIPGEQVVADSFCEASSRPPSSNIAPRYDGCGVAWAVGPWSEPQPSCSLSAVRVREVVCAQELTGAARPDSECDAQSRPASTSVGPSYIGCTYSWHTGPWGAWSSTCSSSATRTRVVHCRREIDGAVANDDACGLSTRPPSVDGPTLVTTGCEGVRWAIASGNGSPLGEFYTDSIGTCVGGTITGSIPYRCVTPTSGLAAPSLCQSIMGSQPSAATGLSCTNEPRVVVNISTTILSWEVSADPQRSAWVNLGVFPAPPPAPVILDQAIATCMAFPNPVFTYCTWHHTLRRRAVSGGHEYWVYVSGVDQTQFRTRLSMPSGTQNFEIVAPNVAFMPLRVRVVVPHLYPALSSDRYFSKAHGTWYLLVRP